MMEPRKSFKECALRPNKDRIHCKKSLQEEYRELLEKHGIEYDEWYIWG